MNSVPLGLGGGQNTALSVSDTHITLHRAREGAEHDKRLGIARFFA